MAVSDASASTVSTKKVTANKTAPAKTAPAKKVGAARQQGIKKLGKLAVAQVAGSNIQTPAKAIEARTPDPATVVRNCLSGQIPPESYSKLNSEAQTLLAEVLILLNRGGEHLDASNKLKAGSLNKLLMQLLGVDMGRASSIMRGLRTVKAYTSTGSGAGTKTTFTGSELARAIVSQMGPGAVAAAPPQSDQPKVDIGTLSDLDDLVAKEILTAMHAKTSGSDALVGLLADKIAGGVWRDAGYRPEVVKMVALLLKAMLLEKSL